MIYFSRFFNNVNNYVDKEVYMSNDILTMASCITSAEFAVDRADILNKYSKFNIGIPDNIEGMTFDKNIKYENNSLEDICYQVSNDFIKKVGNRKIGLLWSGGIDSTLVICAFLQNKNVNLNQLSILLTKDSINENEYFFKNFIQNRCHYLIFDANNFRNFINEIYSDYIFISGSHGDEMFGNKISLTHPQFYGLRYSDVLVDIYKIFLYNRDIDYIRKLVDYHLSIYQEYFANIFNFEITTTEDFAWALAFMCKWNCLRIDSVLRCNNTDLFSCYYTFFSHTLFQSWALYNKKYNKHNKINPYINASLYKKEFKDYIYNYDKNTEYYNNKSKRNSLVEYTNDKNSNEFIIYSNHGIDVCKVNKHLKHQNNTKWRDMYEVHKKLKSFYKTQ